MQNEVMTPQRLPRIEGFRVTYSGGTPTLAEGTHRATIADTGTGHLTLTYTQPFSRIPLVVASAVSTSKLYATVEASSVTACQIKLYADDGTATDPSSAMNIFVFGYDTADQNG